LEIRLWMIVYIVDDSGLAIGKSAASSANRRELSW
jgi:hypothetical protein